MVQQADSTWHGIDEIAARDPHIAAALARVGYPQKRARTRGHAGLLRAIVAQQLSARAASTIWARLDALIGDVNCPASLLAQSDEDLRAAGLSHQKISYARDLAHACITQRLRLDDLPAQDEDAIALLTQIRGIGRWSAEIYLLFAEGRPDIWPAGDLALRVELGHLLGLAERPSEQATRAHAEAWRPHRSALARFLWHHYGARQT